MARRPWRPRNRLFFLPAVSFFGLLYIYPLGCLIWWSLFSPSFGLDNYRTLATPAYLQALLNTLEISSVVTLFSLLLSYPLAYALTMASPAVQMILLGAILVPFWTSILVRSFAWVVILGNHGLINQGLLALGLIDRPVQLIYNALGVQIAMVHVMLPFMVIPLYGVMARIDRSLVQAARSLGATRRQAFWNVFFPLSMPGVIAGSALVFLLATGFYITPALLGGSGQITIPMMIDMAVNELLNLGMGSALGVLLLAVCGTIYVVLTTLPRAKLAGDVEAR
ncbi:MAG TPA: ABC transporter permease [Geminicoccaceae bacterium]|nr:ABC transporter permease [Geminicoccaceae bacterium]